MTAAAAHLAFLLAPCSTFSSKPPTSTAKDVCGALRAASKAELNSPIDLQAYHEPRTPSSTMLSLSESCISLGVEAFDVYGDYHLGSNSSYLRKFEAELAEALGKEDAVFMPSGVMAQSIALSIHSRGGGGIHADEDEKRFACHETSHLLLHEEDSYREILGMDVVVIATKGNAASNGLCIPPLRLSDVRDAFAKERRRAEGESKLSEGGLSTLILELPHRELGGKLTPWEEVLRIGEICRKEGVKYHCDGARIFEASAGYGLSLSELARPFDSIYISFYKGLGGLSGAMLLGEETFCSEARTWLRRFGGNLYTLLPYAVAGWAGYREHMADVRMYGGMTFSDKQEKMIRLVRRLSSHESIHDVVAFDPEVPETNMVHGYLRAPLKECEEARDSVETKTGIRVLDRMREVPPGDPVRDLGFGARFEWTMGPANGSIDDDVFMKGWNEFALALRKPPAKR